MHARRSALLIAVGAVAALNGCGDPTAIDAQIENIEAQVAVFALNGTPATLPSAIAVRAPQAVRIDAEFRFDLAFDINAAGEVQVHTVRHVASTLVPTHRVGLQFTDEQFDQVTRAPTAGYVYDSTFVVPTGRTILIDILEVNCSTAILGPNIRAKAVIDSVALVQRKIYLSVLSNPNCGFRSLTPGLPKE